MPEETKVPVVPETTVETPVILNPREIIENAVIAKNDELTDSPQEESTDSKSEENTSEPKPESEELSQVERIKQSVQKRIDKVVAKQKSAEEQLAEAQAEIARLKANPTQEVKKDDAPPTIEQVEAYIIKMREEGNVKEELAANRYLIKLEKEAAIKEFEDRQNKIKQEGEERLANENKALSELAKDYIAYNSKGEPDMKSDLTLANQKGKLFQTAMALYNDKELHKAYYNDPDRALGFRRAVQDASRELHAQGLVNTPKVDGFEIPRRQVLADPESTEIEETPQAQSNLSDADKVRDEIKSRNKMRNIRKVL